MHWRRPTTLLTVGLVVGFIWAFLFNGILGARLGIFYYGRVIPGLALWDGTKHQYPLYDALAMGVKMMVFTYILGRTDPEGRTIIETWADTKSTSPFRSSVLSDRRRRRRRQYPLRCGLRAPPHHEVGGSGDRRAHGPLVPRRAEPTSIGRPRDPGWSDPLSPAPATRTPTPARCRTSHRTGESHAT